MLWLDIRSAIRSLARLPLLVAMTTASIGLGVGVNVTVYSVLRRVMFDSAIAADRPESLIQMRPELSYPNYEDLRASGAVPELAAMQTARLIWRTSTATSFVSSQVVSANFFEVIGVRALHGRTFSSDDARLADGLHVVVLSFGFWQQWLGGDFGIIGRPLNLNGGPYVVVGVLPRAFFTSVGPMVSPSVYVPVSSQVTSGLTDRTAAQFDLVGRVGRGTSSEQADAAVGVAAAALEQRFPEANRGLGRLIHAAPVVGLGKWSAVPAGRALLTVAGMLFTVVNLVLLVVCANVAGLLLARAEGRQREISIRVALGATRWRLTQQFFAESFAIATLGGAAGALLWAVSATLLPRTPLLVDAGVSVVPGPLPLGYCLVLVFGVTICCGIVPALAASQVAPRFHMQGGAPSRVIGPLGLRGWLVTGQVTLCCVLLIAGSLMLHSLLQMQTTNPGFDVSRTIALRVRLPTNTPANATPAQSFADLSRILMGMPNVESVSCVRYPPLSLVTWRASAFRPTEPADATFTIDIHPVGPRYLKTMGIPLQRGRDFEESDFRPDRPGSTPLIVNETLARRYEGVDAIGERLSLVTGGGREQVGQIVGVARDSKLRTLGEGKTPLVYLPELTTLLMVRTRSSIPGTAHSMEQAVARQVPGAAAVATPMTDQLGVALLPTRAVTALLAALGGLGLALATVGLYGMISYAAKRRTFEIGVRMALGATRFSVGWTIVRDGILLVGLGCLAGVTLSSVLVRALRPMLAADVRMTDPWAFLGVPVLLLAVGTSACLWPAWRTTGVDPMIALRRD